MSAEGETSGSSSGYCQASLPKLLKEAINTAGGAGLIRKRLLNLAGVGEVGEWVWELGALGRVLSFMHGELDLGEFFAWEEPDFCLLLGSL